MPETYGCSGLGVCLLKHAVLTWAVLLLQGANTLRRSSDTLDLKEGGADAEGFAADAEGEGSGSNPTGAHVTWRAFLSICVQPLPGRTTLMVPSYGIDAPDAQGSCMVQYGCT